MKMAGRTVLLSVLLFLLYERTNCLKCFSKYSPYLAGYYMEARDCPGATLRNSTLNDQNIVCCILDSTIVPSAPRNIDVSLEVYLNMVGETTRTRTLYPFYIEALWAAGILSKHEIAAFTAQILYQTSGMLFSEENSNGQEYQGRESLGNTKAADARKYISRGFLPLIGKHMYQIAKSSIGTDIVKKPEMVALPSVGFKVAAWLWKNGYSSADNSSLPTGNLAKFCDGTEYSFAELSINTQQSVTGIEKLFQQWRHTLKVLGMTCPLEGTGPRCSVDNRNGRCKLVTSCKGEYSTTGCPGPSPITCCLDCQNSIDLVFVVDSSASVMAANFQLGLQFIIKVCEYFDIAYPHGTRVALIRYNQLPTIIFRFNTFIAKQDVLNAIAATPFQAGSTHTDKALLEAYKNLFMSPDNGVRPKELGVPRVLVLLTDGITSLGTDTVIEPSNLLRQEGVNIFVMGIGPRINKKELDIIASDPDADHVVLPKSFEEINTLVENIRERSCYEPALLEEGKEVVSSVKENSVKYFKYDLLNKTRIKTAFLETTLGRADISVSMNNRNPRNNRIDLGSCEPSETNKLSGSDSFWQLEELEYRNFCNVTTKGGCTKPRFVSREEFVEEGLIIYVKTCSSRWFYVSLEGTNKTNTFNLTLFKDLVRTRKISNTMESSVRNDTTFPIPKTVYAGAVVAAIVSTATVAAVVTLSCAKEFKVKASTKIKKKKKKGCKTETDNNCNSVINEGYEEDDDELQGTKNRTSLTPLIEDDDLGTSSGETSPKKKTIFATERTTNEISGTKNCKRGNYGTDQGKCCVVETREKELIQKNSSCVNENQKDKNPRKVSLVSSMIYDLQREDTFTEKPATSTFQGVGNSRRCGSRFERQITSTSVSVSVVQSRVQDGKIPSGQNRVRKIGLDTMKRNCEMLLKDIGDTGNTKAKQNEPVTLNYYKDQRKCSGNETQAVNGDSVEKQDASSMPHSKKSKLIQEKGSETETTCCFQWKPSLSNQKVRKTSKVDELSKLEKNENEVEVRNCEKEKDSLLVRIKTKLTKRKIMAAMCPCFTYLILKGEAKENRQENEKRQSEEAQQEMRDKRFERDMQMSQTFCVLLSQLLFLLGADARDDKIACAVVAITMNYLSLVTLCWLVVQALYLFNFTRARESEEKQMMKIKLYYAGAWGLPLLAVVILASKYDTYNKHPHCWISFTDAISWSVATPIITLGLVQMILIILLAKALVTYRKSEKSEENEHRKSIIKSGIQTVLCITITVILTWLLGSLSLNNDRDVYHTFFTIFNALQGFAFFLFYVLLNPEIRRLILAGWEWKQSMVTPFDEHEAIEIEEEEKKDKKKRKGKPEAMNNNTQDTDQRKQENKPDQNVVNTIQTLAEARMAASLIATNSKPKIKANDPVVKSTVKNEIQKFESLAGTNTSAPPRKLPPIEQHKETAATPRKGEARRKITPHGPPQNFVKDQTIRRQGADAPTSPKKKNVRSPSSPYTQRSRTPPGKKGVNFEVKDNLPVAAFTSPPPNARTRPSQPALKPISTPEGEKQMGKKRTTKGKKST